MKKFIVLLFSLATLQLNAASITTGVIGATTTNLLGAGSAKITLLSVAATTNNVTMVLYDSPDGTPAYTNPGYTNVLSYVTNTYVFYTNYFGRTNGWTNYFLVDLQQTVASTTISYPILATVNVPSNTTVTINPANFTFMYGAYATNTLSGSFGAVTVQYLK